MNKVLLTVKGRPPLCLKCHGVGHVRATCNTPVCRICKVYGHTIEDCTTSKTYAKALSEDTNESQSEAIDSESFHLTMSPTQSDTVMETENTPSYWPSPDLAKYPLLTWEEEHSTSNLNPTPSITQSSSSTDNEFHTLKRRKRAKRVLVKETDPVLSQFNTFGVLAEDVGVTQPDMQMSEEAEPPYYIESPTKLEIKYFSIKLEF